MNVPITNPNLARLANAARKLTPLLDQIAFVGGCITGLLVTDPAAAPARPTIDVDVIASITSYAELATVETRLRELDFHQPLIEGSPVCRWVSGELVLDLMPTESSILGFSNVWYGPALEKAERVRVADQEIRVITAPYFVATKLEAFHGRGQNNFSVSHDIEDIVTVIDGRQELAGEVRAAPDDLRQYLRREFTALLSNRDFLEALPGYLLPDSASQQRLRVVVTRIEKLVEED